MKVSDLISLEYLEEQRRLHASPRGYGGRGDKWAEVVWDLYRQLDCRSVLDYGCGQGTLARALSGRVGVAEYDPAIKRKAQLPVPADLVVCTDVLEHIEPDRVAVVLQHLHSLARKALLAVIATRPASKFLSDGRNAHISLHDAAWWRSAVLKAGFRISDDAPASPSRKASREVVYLLTPGKGTQ